MLISSPDFPAYKPDELTKEYKKRLLNSVKLLPFVNSNEVIEYIKDKQISLLDLRKVIRNQNIILVDLMVQFIEDLKENAEEQKSLLFSPKSYLDKLAYMTIDKKDDTYEIRFVIKKKTIEMIDALITYKDQNITVEYNDCKINNKTWINMLKNILPSFISELSKNTLNMNCSITIPPNDFKDIVSDKIYSYRKDHETFRPLSTIHYKHAYFNSSLESTIEDGYFANTNITTNNCPFIINFSISNQQLPILKLIDKDSNNTTELLLNENASWIELLKRLPVDINTLHPFLQNKINLYFNEPNQLSEDESIEIYENYEQLPHNIKSQLFEINRSKEISKSIHDLLSEYKKELEYPQEIIKELNKDITYQVKPNQEAVITCNDILTEEEQNLFNLLKVSLEQLSTKYELPFKNGQIDLDSMRDDYQLQIDQLDEKNKDLEETIEKESKIINPYSNPNKYTMNEIELLQSIENKAKLVIKQNKINDNYQEGLFKVDNDLYTINTSLTKDLSLATNISINEDAFRKCSNFVTKKELANYISNNQDNILKTTPVNNIQFTKKAF